MSNYLFNRIKFNYIIFFAIFFSGIVMFNDELNFISLYFLLPGVFLYTFVKSNTLLNSKYLFCLAIIYSLAALLWFEAENKDVASHELNRVLGSFILCYIFTTLSANKKYITFFYIMYLFILLSMLYYAYNNLGIMNIDIYSNERLNDSKLNANTLGYFSFFATFASFILAEMYHKKSRFLYVIFYLIVLLTFYLAFVTASRQILIIEIPFVLLLLFFKYRKNFKHKNILLIPIFIAIILFLSVNISKNIYEGSNLQKRNEVSVKDDARAYLIYKAIDVGLEHPLTGVGPGQFIFHNVRGNFSHCTYTELFANYGVIPTFLFLLLVIIPTFRAFKKYKKSKGDLMYLYFFLFFVFLAIDNLFYVYYLDLWLMGFWFIVLGHFQQYCYEKANN